MTDDFLNTAPFFRISSESLVRNRWCSYNGVPQESACFQFQEKDEGFFSAESWPMLAQKHERSVAPFLSE